MVAGLWIIIGAILGVTGIVTVALWMWSKKIKKGKLPVGKDGNVSLLIIFNNIHYDSQL